MKTTSIYNRTCDLSLLSQVNSTKKRNISLNRIFNTVNFKRNLGKLVSCRKNIRLYFVFFLVTLPAFNLLAQPVFTWNGGVDPANVTCNENASLALSVTASGTGLLSYSVSGETDAALFNIVISSGLLNFNSLPNYETPIDSDGNNIYEVVVRADDAGNSLFTEQTILITVNNVMKLPLYRLQPALVFLKIQPA